MLVALIAVVPAIVSAWFAYLIHRNIKTPSGDRIGAVMERTHEASTADLALTTQVHRAVTNGRGQKR